MSPARTCSSSYLRGHRSSRKTLMAYTRFPDWASYLRSRTPAPPLRRNEILATIRRPLCKGERLCRQCLKLDLRTLLSKSAKTDGFVLRAWQFRFSSQDIHRYFENAHVQTFSNYVYWFLIPRSQSLLYSIRCRKSAVSRLVESLLIPRTLGTEHLHSPEPIFLIIIFEHVHFKL